MSSATPELEPAAGPQLSRRGLMRGIAAGAAATAVGWNYAVERSSAAVPLVVVGAGIAVGWLAREEWKEMTADDVPEGLTPEVLKTNVYEIARNRQSNDQSTFVDNRNLVELGYEDSLYSEGKEPAIEALNDEKTESEVLSAANAAVDSQATTVKKNFLKSWNETVNEIVNLGSRVESHPDVEIETISASVSNINSDYDNDFTAGRWVDSSRDVSLPNGESFTLKEAHFVGTTVHSDATTDDYEATWDPLQKSGRFDSASSDVHHHRVKVVNPSGGNISYAAHADWNEIWSLLDAAEQNVRDGLSTWVTNLYDQVQAGDIETSELFTSRELAEMTSDDEEFPRAVADLMAMNVAVDLEREAEIHFPDENVTVYGALAPSSEPENPPTAGDTIDPSSRSEDYYLTYDVSQASGSWDAYNTGVDGGVVTFTAEPHPRTVYEIETTAGEKVQVGNGDFTDQGDGTWTVDLSDDLEIAITEIAAVEFWADVDQTQYETILLDSTFEIVTYRDSEGNEHASADFTQSEPHDDENYITEEEWEERRKRYEEMIEEYEQSKEGGALADFGFSIGEYDVPGAGVVAGTVVCAAGALGVAKAIFS